MKIKSIELYNYRLYKGINKINFQEKSDKNLYLISGENGFGKTTFLHSLLWCLYGRLVSDIDDTFRKEMYSNAYKKTLQNNLNNSCQQKIESEISSDTITQIKKIGYTIDNEYLKEYSQYHISLEFTEILIPSIPCKSIKIIRSYDVILEEESVEILIDGIPNELTNEIGHEIFINDFILNKDIARFFFFDSERIVALAETNTIAEKRKLCSAYNEVLGVKKYEDLKRNLENLRLRFRRKSADIKSREKLTELLTEQKILNSKSKEEEQLVEELNSKLTTLRKEDERLQLLLLREGNDTTLEKLNQQKAVLEVTQKKDAEYKARLKQFLEFAPFAISGKLLDETRIQLEKDFEILQTENNVENQNILLQNISVEMQEALNNISLETKTRKELMNSFQSIVAKYQNQTKSGVSLLNISKEDLDEFLAVYSNITSTYKVEFEYLADDYRKNKQVLDRTARNLSNMQSKESDSVIKKIRAQKNESERNIFDIEEKIRKIHEKRGAINKELSVLGRQISELSKKVSLDDSDSKKDKVAEELINELNSFLVSLKKQKKSALESRIKSTMNELMHKSDFIDKVDVVIVDDTIDINLYEPNGNIIKKETLSKGEQQLYATSLLKGLVDESGIQFPVFIDSPLQKFDKRHSNKIITEFYPSISKQVILLPLLHKELTKSELDIMKPYVNSSYLIKNENTYSYIQPVDIDNFMKE